MTSKLDEFKQAFRAEIDRQKPGEDQLTFLRRKMDRSLEMLDAYLEATQPKPIKPPPKYGRYEKDQ